MNKYFCTNNKKQHNVRIRKTFIGCSLEAESQNFLDPVLAKPES